jgi:transposase
MIDALKPIETQCNFNLTIPGQNLEKNNIVFLVRNIVMGFLEEFRFLLKGDEKKIGRNKDYKTIELLGLVVLGTLNNVNSCRGLEKWVKNNDETCTYVLDNKKPSKSTISRFFKGRELLIELLFEYIVEIGLNLDLIGTNHASFDGTVLKANASRYKLITIEELKYLENLIISFDNLIDYTSIKSELKKYYVEEFVDENNENLIKEVKNNLKQEATKLLVKALKNSEEEDSVLKFIDYLKENYDGKHTISVTAPECRWMKDKKGNIGLNYNYQVVTDDKNDFIVAQKLVNDPTDHKQAIPMMQQTKKNLSKYPDFSTLDNGYLTNETLEFFFRENINAVIPDRNESSKIKNKTKDNKFKKPNFQYNWDNDAYICPENKILKYKNNRKINKEIYRVYSTNECKNCKELGKCTSGRKREIFDLAHPLRRKMQENYRSDFGRQLYKKRFHTGETYFATLKESRNFRGIKRKTIKKAQMELTLQAIAHNIKIIHKHLCT